MTDISYTDQHPHRTALTLRRAAAAGTMLVLGLLAPTAAGASPANDPPVPEGPDELGIEQPCQPDLCSPEPPEPPECPPFVATCDLAPGGDGPDDPEPPEPPEPPTGDPGEPSATVDAPVVAAPNFTG